MATAPGISTSTIDVGICLHIVFPSKRDKAVRSQADPVRNRDIVPRSDFISRGIAIGRLPKAPERSASRAT
ncbi:MAG TPA: hypothetical protein VN176_00590 [Verrucomicrobiae bacterium]|nr:hypothetical protein [Verrucomicrobiae bacterium]